MTDLDKAIATQLANIVKRTGKSIPELTAIVKGSGLSKHGELVAMLKSTLGMGHGDANTLVHTVLKSDGQSAAAAQGLSAEQVLDGLYTGPKEVLRPIHDKLIAAIRKFGNFEEAPKKTYVSYRRKKQFAMIGPATKTRVEVGLNMKGVESYRPPPAAAGRTNVQLQGETHGRQGSGRGVDRLDQDGIRGGRVGHRALASGADHLLGAPPLYRSAGRPHIMEAKRRQSDDCVTTVDRRRCRRRRPALWRGVHHQPWQSLDARERGPRVHVQSRRERRDLPDRCRCDGMDEPH